MKRPRQPPPPTLALAPAPAPSPRCEQCRGTDSPLQMVAICQRGRLEVHVVFLHPGACEDAYIKRVDGAQA